MTRQEKIDEALQKALEAKNFYKSEEKRLKQLWIDAEDMADKILNETEDD